MFEGPHILNVCVYIYRYVWVLKTWRLYCGVRWAREEKVSKTVVTKGRKKREGGKKKEKKQLLSTLIQVLGYLVGEKTVITNYLNNYMTQSNKFL